MTTKNSFYAFAALAALTLAGCNNDEDFVRQDDLKDTPITVHAAVAELTSRAGYEGTTSLPDKFYLSIDQDGEKYDYTNVLMNNVDGAWTAYESDGETEKQLLWAGGSVKVTAATFSLIGAQTLKAQTDQSMEDKLKASDHLYMAETKKSADIDGINVELSHIMSKIELTITLGDEFASDENPISGVTFTGTVVSRKFDYTSEPKWSDLSDATTADITAFESTYDKEKISATYEVILVPQEVAEGTFAVSFRVRDREFKWTSSDAVTLTGGTKYTLALNAGKDKVSSASFTAGNWTDDTNTSTGTY